MTSVGSPGVAGRRIASNLSNGWMWQVSQDFTGADPVFSFTRCCRTDRRRYAAHCRRGFPGGSYSPLEPQVAVLEPGVSLDVLYLPAMASLVLLTALALVWWGGWRLFQVIAG